MIRLPWCLLFLFPTHVSLSTSSGFCFHLLGVFHKPPFSQDFFLLRTCFLFAVFPTGPCPSSVQTTVFCLNVFPVFGHSSSVFLLSQILPGRRKKAFVFPGVCQWKGLSLISLGPINLGSFWTKPSSSKIRLWSHTHHTEPSIHLEAVVPVRRLM